MMLAAIPNDVEMEAACRALGLDEADTRYVLASHRRSDGKLIRTCMDHNCDLPGYVQVRLAIREGVREALSGNQS